jgi:hypothetical protein
MKPMTKAKSSASNLTKYVIPHIKKMSSKDLVFIE